METTKKIEYLTEPMTIEEIKKNKDENNDVAGIISIHISDIIDRNYEDFLDYIAEMLVDNVCLMSIDYEIVGINPDCKNEILLRVSGDVSSILEMEEDSDQEE